MNRTMRIASLLALVALCSLGVGAARAWHVAGTILCDETGLPIRNVIVTAVSTDGTVPFTGTSTTDEAGYYWITLPNFPQCFRISVGLAAGDTPVSPASGFFDVCTTDESFQLWEPFVITGPSCGNGACWLTAGGAKFDPVFKGPAGTSGPDDTWGGNVYPGCSPTAGDGGQWNHVAHSRKLHFQGREITVLRCGNVDGIPPGSTSPPTPFNFIEFTGTGTLKGIQGNKADFGTVYFWGHCEDRNEPGSSGERDGAFKDRYFLNVYTNPADPVGSSVLLEDVDGNPATVDPITITDGNMQIHISSCEAPPVLAFAKTPPGQTLAISAPFAPMASAPTAGEVWFASPSPSPARATTRLRFGLPHEASVSFAAFDVTGRRVCTFAEGRLTAGEHSFDWRLATDAGQRLRSGVYFVRLVVDGNASSKPVVVTP